MMEGFTLIGCVLVATFVAFGLSLWFSKPAQRHRKVRIVKDIAFEGRWCAVVRIELVDGWGSFPINEDGRLGPRKSHSRGSPFRERYWCATYEEAKERGRKYAKRSYRN